MTSKPPLTTLSFKVDVTIDVSHGAELPSERKELAGHLADGLWRVLNQATPVDLLGEDAFDVDIIRIMTRGEDVPRPTGLPLYRAMLRLGASEDEAEAAALVVSQQRSFRNYLVTLPELAECETRIVWKLGTLTVAGFLTFTLVCAGIVLWLL